MQEYPPAVPRLSAGRAWVRTILTWIILICPAAAQAGEQQPFRARHGIVVSANALANRAGTSILRRGGTAVDAAVATAFALAVVFPEAGNIGGGGYLLLRLHDGKSAAIDFRETAPRHAQPGLYLDSAGRLNGKSLDGHLSVAVPGTVAGLLLALESYGTMPRSEIIAPAIELAEHGFPVDARMVSCLTAYTDKLRMNSAAMERFFPDGRPLKEGDTLRQPDLANTLRRIAKTGADDFYRGVTARLMLDEMRNGGGVMDGEDLQRYRPVVREPLTGTYRGYDILAMPPSTSGGVCLLEALNMAECFNFPASGFHSAGSIHLLAEILKRVFADRSGKLGDPAFTQLPVARLISKEYARRQAGRIDTSRVVQIRPDGSNGVDEGRNTTHVVVIDSLRNVVSLTYTVNDLFGSKVLVRGGGFFLNDEMDDFSVSPGVPNIFGLTGGKANAIEPGKRPLSSMTPAIVLKNGQPVVALGARGGSRIITAVLQVIMNMIDYKMDVRSAIGAPRIHHQWLPDTIVAETGAISPEHARILKGMGQSIDEVPQIIGACNAAAYILGEDLLEAGPDPRENASADGY